MALGAGFKLKDKEREKEKDKDRDKEKDRETDREYDKEKERDRQREREREKVKEAQHRVAKHEYDEHHGASSGWTSILEDWFCHGVQELGVAAAKSATRPDARPKELLSDAGRAFSTGDIKRRSMAKPIEYRKGPYEMLTKERMMGLYLAVFIHRDARHLVQGTHVQLCVEFLI